MIAAADPAEPAPDGGRHRDPGRVPARLSRRWFLAGGAAVVVGGGVGVGAGFLRHESRPAPNPAPAELLAAEAAEHTLIVLAGAAGSRDATLHTLVAVLLDDHRAHLAAVRSALAGYDRPRATPTPSPSLVVPDRSRLGSLERAAGVAAAARAQRLSGARATLLASIAACEATHAELLA